MTYRHRSFLPATKFDHPLAVELLAGSSTIRLTVGGRRTMASILTPETALEVAECLVNMASTVQNGPTITAITIHSGPPPEGGSQ
jgi:hypothetical protein